MKMSIEWALTKRIIIVEAESTDTIMNVKEKIEEMEGVPVSEQIIVYCGYKLENQKQLNDYNNPTQGIHILFEKRNMLIQVNAGEPFSLEYRCIDKIKDIKFKIQGILGLPLHQQRLFYGEILLNEDDQTCVYYKIIGDIKIQLDKIE